MKDSRFKYHSVQDLIILVWKLKRQRFNWRGRILEQKRNYNGTLQPIEETHRRVKQLDREIEVMKKELRKRGCG